MEEPTSRNTKKYQIWRNLVFQRDNLKCRHCEETEGLCAHHIIGWDEDKKLRYDLDNGLSLCRSCHIKIHYDAPNLGMKDRTHSLEAKKKMSIAKIGISPWNKGKKSSKQAIEKMRAAKLGVKRGSISEETRSKMSAAHKGKVRGSPSAATRAKMSESQRKRNMMETSPYKGKTWRKCHETGKRIWIEIIN